jgi:hypothetical protein
MRPLRPVGYEFEETYWRSPVWDEPPIKVIVRLRVAEHLTPPDGEPVERLEVVSTTPVQFRGITRPEEYK